MVRQRVTGTEWCIQMSVMICFELPVAENCELCCWCCCCYTSLCMVSSQASLGIVYPGSTDIWADLCAESARAVRSVSMLCEHGYTPARQDQIWAVYNWCTPPWTPPPLLGALGRCEVSLCAAWAEPGQVCLTWLNPLWLLHSHLAVHHLCSRKKTIFKLLVYMWKWRVYFRGLLGYENKPAVKLWRGYL